jgi:septal ring factor EnvC (AmiA/AmiB activator)
MKKYLLVLALPLLFLGSGCNQKKIDRLTVVRDSLMAVSSAKEANIAEFVTAFNEIEANLDSIKAKEKVIDKSTQAGEVKGNRKEQIKSDIAYIYSLQVKNRQKVADLTASLKKSGKHSAELQKMIDNLNNSIADKDKQIASLTDDLGKVNIQVKDLNLKVGDLNNNVSNLTAETQQKQQVIEEKTAALNTAYYVMGTSKELKDKKIITPTGGFIGLGRAKELTPDVDMSNLTKVDITTLNEIPIGNKKVTMVTSHPKDSYRLEGFKTVDKLVILKPAEFWSKSKVLVMVLK